MESKLTKPVIYSLVFAIVFGLIGTLVYRSTPKKTLKPAVDYTYVSKLFDNGVKSVVSTSTVIMRPYNNADVKVLKGFYDYQGQEKDQENSLINYDTTYIQNSGIAYGGINDTFDVTSVLDGQVTSVKDDKLLGKVVTIKNSNNIVTTYESLSEVTVKENDQITQGTVIGKAGESNLEKDLGNHLLFEISVDGKFVNPDNCYDKIPDQLKSN